MLKLLSQTPSVPLPTAAVEPACGDERDGSVSLTPPDDELLEDDELLDELLDELEDDDEAAGEVSDGVPPPPPHAASKLSKNRQEIDI